MNTNSEISPVTSIWRVTTGGALANTEEKILCNIFRFFCAVTNVILALNSTFSQSSVAVGRSNLKTMTRIKGHYLSLSSCQPINLLIHHFPSLLMAGNNISKQPQVLQVSPFRFLRPPMTTDWMDVDEETNSDHRWASFILYHPQSLSSYFLSALVKKSFPQLFRRSLWRRGYNLRVRD